MSYRIISIDNGQSFMTIDELFENEEFLAHEDYYIGQIVENADPDVFGSLALELATEFNNHVDPHVFLRRYVELPAVDLIVVD